MARASTEAQATKKVAIQQVAPQQVATETESDALDETGVASPARNALMDAAYDDQVYVDDRTIDSHIKRLRKKFKASDNEFDMIETLYGVGYRFKE